MIFWHPVTKWKTIIRWKLKFSKYHTRFGNVSLNYCTKFNICGRVKKSDYTFIFFFLKFQSSTINNKIYIHIFPIFDFKLFFLFYFFTYLYLEHQNAFLNYIIILKLFLLFEALYTFVNFTKKYIFIYIVHFFKIFFTISVLFCFVDEPFTVSQKDIVSGNA